MSTHFYGGSFTRCYCVKDQRKLLVEHHVIKKQNKKVKYLNDTYHLIQIYLKRYEIF